jgi:hypothetical protein
VAGSLLLHLLSLNASGKCQLLSWGLCFWATGCTGRYGDSKVGGLDQHAKATSVVVVAFAHPGSSSPGPLPGEWHTRVTLLLQGF